MASPNPKKKYLIKYLALEISKCPLVTNSKLYFFATFIIQVGERICKCSGGKNQGVFPKLQFDNGVPISGVVRKK